MWLELFDVHTNERLGRRWLLAYSIERHHRCV